MDFFIQSPKVATWVILILTFRRAWGGLYCTKCRQMEMLKAKLITLLLGWWGIPFGPIFSLGVLFSPSEGKIPPEENAKYLAALSGYFIMRGEMAYAQEAMEMSLGYKSDQELTNLYHDIYGHGKHTFKKPKHGTTSGLLFGLGTMIGLSIILFSLSGFFSSSVTSEKATPTPSCINWSLISSYDLGKYLCVYGRAKSIDSNSYYATIIRFSETPTKLIFVDTKYEYPDLLPGKCVAVKGKVTQLEKNLAIYINGNLYEYPCP